MIGKNNKKLKELKQGVKVESYSIKKFKFGAASIVIGASIFFGTGVASANEVAASSDSSATNDTNATSGNGDKVPEKINTVSAEKESVASVNKPSSVKEESTKVEVEKKVVDKSLLETSITKLEELLATVNKDKAPASTLSAVNVDLINAKSILENANASQEEVDALVKKLKQQTQIVSSMPKVTTKEKEVKEGANTIANSGSRDSRNGQSMGEGTSFRANGEINSGALANIKYFASVDPKDIGGRGNTNNNDPEFTKEHTDIKAVYVEDREGKWIVYDVFFNNNGRKITDGSYQQHYYFQAPFNIMDPSNTVRDLTFTRYRNTGGRRLSDGFQGFEQYGNTATISNPWVQKYHIFNADSRTFYDPNSGVTRDGQRWDVFKNNQYDPTLNVLPKNKNDAYPGLSYYLGVDVREKSTDYAMHMHAKIKLRNDVTPEEAAKYGRVYAATVAKAPTANRSYIVGATGTRLQNDPDAPKDPIKGLTVPKTVGADAGDPINPVSSGYVKHGKNGTFPPGMNWTWKDNKSPSTAEAGVFKYKSIATYKDGSSSEDKNSGSDGTVTLIVKPKQPIITTDVANKKGLTNQQITVNVGSGVKDGSTVKLYDGNTVIGTGITKGQTATVTVKGALPGNPITAETVVNNGGTVTSDRSTPVTPTEAPDNQPPTLTISPAKQEVVEGEKVTFTLTARDNKIVNIDGSDFTTKYGSRLLGGKATNTNEKVTDTEKITTITITTTAEDVGKTNTINFYANDGKLKANNGKPVTFTFTVTSRDKIAPTITAEGAIVTKNEPITPISVTAVDNPGGVGMRDKTPIEVSGLPKGLTYTNGKITGTPTGPVGNSTVTIKAYDKNGNKAEKTITITVKDQASKYNPTGDSLTVNQGQPITDEAVKAKVTNFGPGTLTVQSKPTSTATAGNAGNAVVKVTYSDGSSDTVNVPVTVKDVTGPTITADNATVTKNEPITPIPVTAVDNTGGVGMRDKNPIQVSNLPQGLKYENGQITGTTNAKTGFYTVKITAYDKNNTPSTKPIKITVQEQTSKYNPTGDSLTVNQGQPITDEAVKAKVTNYGPGTLTVESKPTSTATAGNAGNAVVKVTYPDGSTDTVDVPVIVKDVTGPTITANDATVTKNKPITPIPVTAVDNTGGVGMRDKNPIQVSNLPQGLKYENGKITGTTNAKTGFYTVKITAYDKNNTPSTKTIRITVQDQLAGTATGKTVPEKTPVPANTKVVTPNRPGTAITVDGPVNGLTVDNGGNLVGTPTVDNWEPKEEERTVEIPVKLKNGPEEVVVKVPVKIQRDTDGDGIPDVTDPDDDNDGIPDTEDANPKVADKLTGTVTGKTVPEKTPVPANTKVITPNKPGTTITTDKPVNGLTVDNGGNLVGTPTVDNWEPKEEERTVEIPVKLKKGTEEVVVKVPVKIQRDTDGDGIPDVTDPDDDNDGIPDTEEEKNGTDPKTPTTQTPTIEITQQPNGDAIVTPKKPDGSIYPPGTKVEIPGENGTTITVTIGDNGSGEVPNDKLPKKDVPGTGTVTEPNKNPSKKVPVKTPAHKTPKLELEQDPKTGDVTVTPKKPDGSTYPPGTTVEIPGKDNDHPITVTTDDNGKAKVPNADLPEGKVPGTGKITEPDKPTEEVPVETPSKIIPGAPTTEQPVAIEINQKPNGDAVVTPKKQDGNPYPSGTKVEIPGEDKDGNPITITVTIGDNGSGEVPNDKLPKKAIPGTGTVTEPNKNPSEKVPVETPARKTPKIELEQDPKTGDVTVTPKRPDGSTYPSGTVVEIPGKDKDHPITVTTDDNGKAKVPNADLPEGKVPGTGKITEPGKPTEEVPVETPAHKTPKLELEQDPKTGDVTVTPKRPDGSTYPPGTTVEIPGKDKDHPITVTTDDNGKAKVPNADLPEGKVPGTGKITEPGRPTEEVPNVTTPAHKTPTLDVERDPKTGDVTVTPKRPGGGTYPPGTKVEIPGENGPITVEIGQNGKGKVPNDNLPKKDVPGTGKITEPGKPTVEVPNVTTPGKFTPETPVTEQPGEIEITQQPNGNVIVTPKKPDGSTYPPGTKVEIPGEDGTTITVTIGDNGSGEVPNDKLPKGNVPGKGTVTEPNKKPSQPVDVTTPARKTPTLDVEQDPKTGDVTVTPKKPDGSTYPPGTKVEIPGKDGNPIIVTIDKEGKGKVPNSELPEGKVPGTAKITEPGKPTVEVPVITPAKVTSGKVTPETPRTKQVETGNNTGKTEKTSEIKKETKRLANTGTTETNTGLAGLGMAIFGGLLAAAKRRKNKED